jgi:hypothetical protein
MQEGPRSTSGKSHHTKIEVLKGEKNWLVWKTRMECILSLHDLFEYVEGRVPKPDPENENETKDPG